MSEATISPEAAAVEVTPKTEREILVEKYNKLFAQRNSIDEKLAKIVEEVNGIDRLEALTVGVRVIVKIGKGETSKDVEGEIIGEQVLEDGTKQFKVAYGSGMDADVTVKKATQIRLPSPPAEDQAQ